MSRVIHIEIPNVETVIQQEIIKMLVKFSAGIRYHVTPTGRVYRNPLMKPILHNGRKPR